MLDDFSVQVPGAIHQIAILSGSGAINVFDYSLLFTTSVFLWCVNIIILFDIIITNIFFVAQRFHIIVEL